MSKNLTNPIDDQSASLTRRQFLAATGTAATTFTIIPSHVLGRDGGVAANSRINVAFIGAGSQALRVMFEFLAFPEIQPVAVADPVKSAANYHQWSKNEFASHAHKLLGVSNGWEWLSPNAPLLPLTPSFSAPAGVAGREPFQRILEAFNARDKKSGESRTCAAFADYRELLDKKKDVDAVIIGTTDVHHAPAAIAAMKQGKHVFCQKPMAHSLPASLLMAEEAKRSGVATQVALPKQASEETRRLCEWIAGGAVGTVEKVSNWSNRPSWPQGLARPSESATVPEGMDWDLWLGPAPVRPFHPAYFPFVWRGWADFGCGAFGDMGCYSLDSIYRALKLEPPVRAVASSTDRYAETFPKASIIHLDFAARGDHPPVRLTWDDGGLKPEKPLEIDDRIVMPSEGIIFQGSEGVLLCDFNGGKMQLYPKSRRDAWSEPPKTLPRSPGNEQEWINAIKDGHTATGANFEFTAKVTEALHLGNLAARTGESLEWDTKTRTLKGSEAAQRLANPEYRKGWGI